MSLDDTFLPVGAVAPPQRDSVIRLAAFEERSFVAGPGARAVIWVAGCLRRCPNCMKPDLFSFSAGKDVDIPVLAQRIRAIPGLDGVTFSGGEPFEQASALANLSRQLKADGLDIVAYTGYRIEALRADTIRFGSLLAEVDILIDGEYRSDLPGPYVWRGSANQRVHNLRAPSPTPIASPRAVREVQLTVRNNGLRLSGFPDEAMENGLAESLRQKGILVEPV